MAAIAVWAPAAVRPRSEDVHDLTTSIETEVPQTATRVFVLYKVNSAFARGDDPTRPALDYRFDVQVNQALPFMRLGGIENIKVDVRIIAATNVDLQKMMQEGRFREDLYYRLHVITVQLPALRERKDDIPLLVQHFIEKYGVENNKPGLELSAEALDLLIDYDWPGNVRELENVIERATVLTSGSRIDVDMSYSAISALTWS